jgi:hypothetical protein
MSEFANLIFAIDLNYKWRSSTWLPADRLVHRLASQDIEVVPRQILILGLAT